MAEPISTIEEARAALDAEIAEANREATRLLAEKKAAEELWRAAWTHADDLIRLRRRMNPVEQAA